MRVANCDATDNRPANKMNEKELCGSNYIREHLLLSLSFSLSLCVFLGDQEARMLNFPDRDRCEA